MLVSPLTPPVPDTPTGLRFISLHYMAEGKRSFLLYTDIVHTVDIMTDEQAGKLFRHILHYVNDRDPQTDDVLLKLAFEPIRQNLKRDLVRYEQMRANRIAAGQASGEARRDRKKQNEQVLTPVQSVEQTRTKRTVNVNVNDSVNVKEKRGDVAVATHPLTIWINTNAPTVQKLKNPLTDSEAAELLADLNIDSDIKKTRLKDILMAMENKPDLLKKYKSANLTIRKWWKLEMDRNPITEQTQAKAKRLTIEYGPTA